MDDDGVWGDLDDIERLLPPQTTEYRSRSVFGKQRSAYEEPATVPEILISWTTRPED